MNATRIDESVDQEKLSASAYYVECLVECSMEHAWPRLLDYKAWNPSFVGALVVPVRGSSGSEGELVLIKEAVPRSDGKFNPEFYAETIKVVPHSHIVWYVYTKEGNAFRNFVDFGLTKTTNGVKFNMYYYAQNPISGETLKAERIRLEQALNTYAQAFKKYCESDTAR